MAILVRPDDLSSPAVQALVAEHLAGVRGHSPPGTSHALALDGLRAADVTFFTAWRDGELCGCGALRQLDPATGEVKSMRTRAPFLRQGVGRAVLAAIVRTAARRGYRRLYLETGTGPAFAASHQLYLAHGFRWCGSFGGYAATDFNVFMVREIGPADGGPADGGADGDDPGAAAQRRNQ